MTLSIATITARSSSVSRLRGVPGGNPRFILLPFPSLNRLSAAKPNLGRAPMSGEMPSRCLGIFALRRFSEVACTRSVPGGTESRRPRPLRQWAARPLAAERRMNYS
jgi:hypothetical protein